MSQIILEQLRLKNFKGIRSLTMDLKSITDVLGANEAGKTTLVDAYTWLLFGKDSQDNKVFNIKTLDKSNNVIHKLEHEVYGVISVDGFKTTLKRIYTEKWQNVAGAPEQTLTGHTTNYFVDDVPMKEKDYKERIASLLDENIFKLLTNPFYFPSLKWEKRREILEEMAGGFNDNDLLAQDRYNKLSELLSNKSIEDLKAQLSSEKKLLKEAIVKLPIRIDEANNNLPDKVDEVEINTQVNNNNTLISNNEKQVSDIVTRNNSKRDAEVKHSNAIANKEAALTKLRFNIEEGSKVGARQYDSKVKESRQNVSNIDDRINNQKRHIEGIERTIANNETDLSRLRNELAEFNKSVFVFDESKTICPTCKQKLGEGYIEDQKYDLEANFNTNKANNQDTIQTRGIAKDKENKSVILTLEAAKNVLSEFMRELKEAQLNLDNLLQNPVTPGVVDLMKHEGYCILTEELTALETTPIQSENLESDNELKLKIQELREANQQLNSKLAVNLEREKGLKRIEELGKEEAILAQKISDLNGKEFMIDEFVNEKITTIENKVNSMFDSIRIKMFEPQINGGLKDVCTILVKGVPFEDANNAGKINAGIEIINALSKFHKQTAPIWVDNAESISNILKSESQMIKLYVSPGYKTLTIK